MTWATATRTPRIFTFTGKAVNPLALKPEDIDVIDIAHSLAYQNRFVGHPHFAINTAQHSVYVSWLMGWSLRGLIHDGSEAYLGDVSKWVKQAPEMAGYRAIEERAQSVIDFAFGIPEASVQEADALKEADALMVRYEALKGWNGAFSFDVPLYDEPLTQAEHDRVNAVQPWRPWTAEESVHIFIETYLHILRRHGWSSHIREAGPVR